MSGLLIPNTFDPKGKTPLIACASRVGTTYNTILNVTGSGYLIGIMLYATNSGYFRVTLDGVVLVDESPLYGGYGAAGGIALTMKFNTSLKVEIKNNTADKSTAGTVAYLLD